ncbi:hypothetical protein [Aliihoeflea sp. 40Bstr573]|uniref:hypothetical protein n=1 Tax=Aliihoeflea sp. 40Bstr573 TaxID=2696467 RepID=UPI002095AF4F|nr:hypothetical protein [Aliihoeflea sp. 40Bstr573]MCO6388757.1 hypothetical protein [Aliihoeflea sp. 40Bstr573]
MASKYDGGVKDEIRQIKELQADATFDFERIVASRLGAMGGVLIAAYLRLAAAIARRTGLGRFPLIPFTILASKKEVAAAFSKAQIFSVPFGPEMQALAGPVTFALGLDDDEHRRQREVMASFTAKDPITHDQAALDRIRMMTNAILDDCGGRIDVVSELFVPVISKTCIRHFGLKCKDPVAFAQWNMAVSYQLFGRPQGSSEDELELVAAASRNLNSCIEASMEAKIAELRAAHATSDTTLIGHLFGLRDPGHTLHDGTVLASYLTDDRIRAIMAGMSSGFVPTTILAAGNLLTALVGRRQRYGALAHAAAAGDRAAVRDIVMEAARFRPAGAPGHFRVVTKDFQFPGSGQRARRFQAGELVLLATGAAMMDVSARKDPHDFKPGCPAKPNFMFGHDHHSCLGRDMATDVITEIFLALFARPGLARRSLLMRRAGPFPWHFHMAFDPPVAPQQSMLTIAVPLDPAATKRIDELLKTSFGNPAHRGTPMHDALEATGIVHNATMCIAWLTSEGHKRPTLLFELNADGTPEQIYAALEKHAPSDLGNLMTLAGKKSGVGLPTFLARHQVRLHAKPWNNIGLNFNGLGDFSVRQIAEEQKLYEAVAPIVHDAAARNLTVGDMADVTIEKVRDLMCGDRPPFRSGDMETGGSPEVEGPAEQNLAALRSLEPLLYRPPGRVPKIADHTDKSLATAILTHIKRPKQLLIMSAPLWLAIIAAFSAFHLGWRPAEPASALSNLISFLAVFTALLISMVVVVVLAVAALVALLRHRERTDTEDLNLTPPDEVATIEAYEDNPGWIQNQMTSVNTLKPGRLRICLLALALFGIGWQVRHWFRSGFVVDIGTIRHAKWFRVKGTDQLVFQANFDGSWEAYLEDFANKAYRGQNAVWSHCEGFIRTRFMVLDGARNADQFKRWVRGKQIVTPFWYSRFPELSNTQIRINALVRDGLAKARTQSEARAWISFFGSKPRPGTSLETDEIQSLIFNAQKCLKHSACIALQFTGDKNDARLMVERRRFVSMLAGKVAPATQRWAEEQNLPHQTDIPAVGFGDVQYEKDALFVAFSHEGLARLGLQAARRNLELDSFSAAFISGMGVRARALGDEGKNSPDGWDWYDRREGDPDDGRTDMLLLPMARNADELQGLIRALSAAWSDCAVSVAKVMTGLVEPDGTTCDRGNGHVSDPLGFKDGISQPVLRGTFRSTLPAPWHDRVEPGEIILGYRDNRDVFPPSPSIAAARDPAAELPELPERMPHTYPAFGVGNDALRDLGRNGTYIAVRQIELDERGFNRQLDEKAQALGNLITAPALAAKIMGRWRNGAPLVRYPATGRAGSYDRHEDGFLYGQEDPQGIRCPFGSHIRRANPRDSFGPNTKVEMEITNRHRILRRGRSYRGVDLRDGRAQVPAGDGEGPEATDGPAEGLLFIAMNASIERQFEFVQQTWINASSFHGLRNEPDPLLHSGEVGSFTIPTANGPVVLTGLSTFARVRGGGYFFMPGRSLLRFLGDNAKLVPRSENSMKMRRA